jgi:hypothetical protein
MQDTFLYLRTKLAMEHETQTFGELARAFPFQAMQSASIQIQYARDPLPVQVISTVWTNGTIIRFRSRMAPVNLAAIMQETLATYDAWAIVGLAGEFADSAGAVGPISRFFGQLLVKTFSQIYIVAGYKDNQYEMAADGIRSSLKAYSSPAFHFLNGKIILATTEEPGRITAGRCRAYLNKMSFWAITDHTGETSSSNNDAWDETYLSSLSYEWIC